MVSLKNKLFGNRSPSFRRGIAPVTASLTLKSAAICLSITAAPFAVSAEVATISGEVFTDSHVSRESVANNPIIQALAANAGYSVFYNALKVSGLLPILDQHNTTIFVPDNKALEKEGSLFLLTGVLLAEENRARLVALLAHHVVQHDQNVDFTREHHAELATLAGSCLSFNVSASSTAVGKHAKVVTTKLTTSGAIVQIDGLLYQAYDDHRICSATP
jgi:uncharacterized surface protein with fasciclin (FAS1) repeats